MITLSANKDYLTSYYPIYLPFITFFPCFIVLARATNTMLNKNGDSKNPCLFPDYRGKVFTLTIKYDASYRLFTDAFYQVEESLFLI